MKDLQMLIWLTQVGISVAAPLAVFAFGAAWLRERLGLGMWIVWLGLALGLICAVSGFRQCLQLMEQMSKDKTKRNQEPPIGFNEHD